MNAIHNLVKMEAFVLMESTLILANVPEDSLEQIAEHVSIFMCYCMVEDLRRCRIVCNHVFFLVQV